MFDHVTIRVGDRTASERFYDTVLAPLGVERTYRTGTFSEWRDFLLTPPGDAKTAPPRPPLRFVAPSRGQGDEVLRAGAPARDPPDARPGARAPDRPASYPAVP